LKEILNPTYQITFSINNEKYVINVESRLSVELASIFAVEDRRLFDQSLTKYRVTVSKILNNYYLRFEDHKEFNTFEDVKNYLLEWQKRADSQ
jgi:hypothetical protein